MSAIQVLKVPSLLWFVLCVAGLGCSSGEAPPIPASLVGSWEHELEGAPRPLDDLHVSFSPNGDVESQTLVDFDSYCSTVIFLNGTARVDAAGTATFAWTSGRQVVFEADGAPVGRCSVPETTLTPSEMDEVNRRQSELRTTDAATDAGAPVDAGAAGPSCITLRRAN